MSANTIAFIGGGNMARSLIGGLLADGYPAERIWVSDPQADNLEAMKGQYAVNTTDDNRHAASQAEAVIFAVKPQVIKAVAEPLGAILRKRRSLVISIAAGVREPDIRRWLGGEIPIVRTMPNTPALVQTGATALFANQWVTPEQKDLAESLLRSAGVTLWLEDESLMDAVTGVSGSGPAYFFLLMELIEESGVALGLPRETAKLLTLQTALGAAKMALESPEDAQTLRRRVTSPNGTTERALSILENGGIRDLVSSAVRAAAARARELGDELGGQ